MLHTFSLWVALLVFFAAIFNPPVKPNLIAIGLFCCVVWALTG